MDISTDTITIKRAEYGFQLSDLLTKKEKGQLEREGSEEKWSCGDSQPFRRKPRGV